MSHTPRQQVRAAVAMRRMAQPVLACLCQRRGRAAGDSAAGSRAQPALGEWTYGRWMMVHMNLELYGWASLPLVGFLFRVYGADRGPVAKWCRPVLWVWSASLGVGVFSWLSGHSSGKLFLDWSGYARVLFPAALLRFGCFWSSP